LTVLFGDPIFYLKSSMLGWPHIYYTLSIALDHFNQIMVLCRRKAHRNGTPIVSCI